MEADLFAEPSPDPSGQPLALAWPPLRRAHHGSEVALVQRLLRLRGYQVPVDGEFAVATDRAVRELQQAWSLPPDGVVGGATWPRLLLELGPDSQAQVQAQVIEGAQQLLRETGLMVEATGRFDEPTTAAIARLQERHCLAATGRLGIYGWSALLSGQRYCADVPLGELPMRQVAQLARDAGIGCGSALAESVAIARAESGLRTQAVHVNQVTAGCPDRSVDVGLWQINDCYHPEVTSRCALDARCNAQAMYAISGGGRSWAPWSTYKSGAYLAYLTEATTAAAQVCAQ